MPAQRLLTRARRYLDNPHKDGGGALRALGMREHQSLELFAIPPGKRTLVKTLVAADNACEALRNASALAMDVEWRAPTRKGGRPGRVAVVQLASAEHTYVFHLPAIGGCPKTLENLLSDAGRTIIGVNIKGDITRVKSDYKFDVGGT